MADSPPPTVPANPSREEEVLPPVEQPSAGFIVQLFVIPGMIVLVIVLLWLGFSWLAHHGTDPAELVRQMRQNRANSWQLAYNFSEELRQNDLYRQDPALAEEVARFLDELLDEPLPPPSGNSLGGTNPRDQEIVRRGFLCRALGEFLVPDPVLPVLIRAASSHTGDDDLRVRLAALEAIALLIENTETRGDKVQPEVLGVLVASSESDDRKIASRATIGLAAARQPEATARLIEMLDEPHHVDVHYNAATGLARLGRVEGLEILEEMLDPEVDRGLIDEGNPAEKEIKRLRILLNALRATRFLASQNPQADLTSLQLAVENLLEQEENSQIRIEARKTLQQLRNSTG